MTTAATPDASEDINDSAADEPSGKKKFILPIVGVLVLVALFWAFNHWNYSRSHESTDNAQVDGHIIPVIAKVGGYVKAVNAVENEPVKAGAVLVQLDDADYRLRVAQANADYQSAEAVSGGGGLSGQAEAQVLTASSQRAALE